MIMSMSMAVLYNVKDRQTGTNLAWSIFYIYMVLFIGLRTRVGMDWNNYLIHYSRVEYQTWSNLFDYHEWLYYLTMFIAKDMGWGIHGSNVIVAIVFCWGWFSFCKKLPNPWMGLLASMPIFIFMFAMSANRQAMAAGILLYLFSKWNEYTVGKKLAFILIASFCHASAVFVGLFLLFDKSISKSVRIMIAFAVMAYFGYSEQNSERFEYYGDLYGGAIAAEEAKRVESKGAFAHVLANAGPALIMLYSYYKKGWARRLAPIYIQMSAVVAILLPLSFIASTAASRVSMYLFPVSLIFFATTNIWAKENHKALNVALALFFIFISVFWFNFSNNGFAFINYKNLLFVE